MKWIIGIFIIFDITYQLWGVSTDVRWWMYYDFVHYGGIFVIGLYYALERRSLLLACFSAYFGFVLGNIIFQIGLTKTEYLKNIKLDAPEFCYFTILILSIFIISKLWGKKSKSNGRY
jgi:hypothetical protein